jgi:nucleoside-triphosphatase THEP1
MQICLVGPPGTGKTRLVRKLTPGASQVSSYRPTAGVERSELHFRGGAEVTVWDAGGRAVLEQRREAYSRAGGFVLFLDCLTMDQLDTWVAEIRRASSAPIVVALDWIAPPAGANSRLRFVTISLEETRDIAAPFLALWQIACAQKGKATGVAP